MGRVRFRRDVRGFFGYGIFLPVILVPFVVAVIVDFVQGPGVIMFVLVVATACFYMVWLSGKVEIKDGVLNAGTRFKPSRVALADVADVVEAPMGGRDVAPAIGLLLDSGELVRVPLTVALGASRKREWASALSEHAVAARKKDAG